MHIALLEDDMLQVELIRGWLTSAEHECVHFQTDAEFRPGARKQVFGLMILDWLLSDDDGVEVLCWLRRSVSAKLPVMSDATKSRIAVVSRIRTVRSCIRGLFR